MTASKSHIGCPWHGLILDSKIMLPNGEEMPIRQPASGYTHLIDFGTEMPETTTDEQADGMSWSNKAILCDGQLHGVEIPRHSWVYSESPTGSNWLATVDGIRSWSRELANVTVTLQRFGEFHAPPETHDYTVPFPNVIADANDAHDVTIRLVFSELFHASPTGSGAIFRVYTGSLGTVSWLEFSVSGVGEDAAISINILRNATQTRGVFTESGTYPETAAFDYVDIGRLPTTSAQPDSGQYVDAGVYPDCNVGNYERVWSMEPVPSALITGEPSEYSRDGFNCRVGAANYTARRDGVIMGVLYLPEGGITEITADISVQAEVELRPPVINTVPRVHSYKVEPDDLSQRCVIISTGESSWSVDVEQSSYSNHAATVTVKVDGVESLTKEVLATLSSTVKSRVTSLTGSNCEEWRSYTYTESGADDITRTVSASNSTLNGATNIAPPWIRPGFSKSPDGRGERAELADSSSLPDFVDRIGYIDYFQTISASRSTMHIQPTRYSNSVYGVSFIKSGANDHGGEVLTHEGVRSAPQLSVDVVSPGASYNPMTGEVFRTSGDQVSWT